MKLGASITVTIDSKEVMAKVQRATKLGVRDTVVDIAEDAIRGSPVLTGNNRRSIQYEVGPGGKVAKKETEGAVYSTSGYGGFLETGTAHMPARPYFRPALDKNLPQLPKNIKAHLA